MKRLMFAPLGVDHESHKLAKALSLESLPANSGRPALPWLGFPKKQRTANQERPFTGGGERSATAFETRS